jgi:hypothetical protein
MDVDREERREVLPHWEGPQDGAEKTWTDDQQQCGFPNEGWNTEERRSMEPHRHQKASGNEFTS